MQCAAHDPLYDIDPRTDASIEVFYADHTLETFGAAQVGSGALASEATRRARRPRARSLRATLRIGMR